jgi:hypothetical protein
VIVTDHMLPGKKGAALVRQHPAVVANNRSSSQARPAPRFHTAHKKLSGGSPALEPGVIA